MSWMGSRPFSVDRPLAVQLKLSDPNMVMHFQFYSLNGGKEQYGKSAMQKLTLTDAPIPIPVKIKPKLPEPVVIVVQNKTEPVIVLV